MDSDNRIPRAPHVSSCSVFPSCHHHGLVDQRTASRAKLKTVLDWHATAKQSKAIDTKKRTTAAKKI
jgi:hypothetical protein